jgi:hypothetical protein
MKREGARWDWACWMGRGTAKEKEKEKEKERGRGGTDGVLSFPCGPIACNRGWWVVFLLLASALCAPLSWIHAHTRIFAFFGGGIFACVDKGSIIGLSDATFSFRPWRERICRGKWLACFGFTCTGCFLHDVFGGWRCQISR